MTDEQLVAFMDAHQDRAVDEARARFAEAVDAVRAGWIFAHDSKQYDRWKSDVAARTGRPQQGRSMANLARDLGLVISGMQVVEGEFEFRDPDRQPPQN